MFPTGYWTPRYWTGKYWPPTGLVVQLPERVPLESVLTPGSIGAVISLTDRLGAILTTSGVISASLQIDDAEAAWLAAEAPPSATLVRGDLSAVLGADSLAVQMPVLYVTSEIVADLLKSEIEDGAVISVVSSGTLEA